MGIPKSHAQACWACQGMLWKHVNTGGIPGEIHVECHSDSPAVACCGLAALLMEPDSSSLPRFFPRPFLSSGCSGAARSLDSEMARVVNTMASAAGLLSVNFSSLL